MMTWFLLYEIIAVPVMAVLYWALRSGDDENPPFPRAGAVVVTLLCGQLWPLFLLYAAWWFGPRRRAR